MVRISSSRFGSSSPPSCRAISLSSAARSSGVRRATRFGVSDAAPPSGTAPSVFRVINPDPFRVGDRDVHGQVAAPRVTDQPGPLPAEVIQHRDRVRDMGLDVERTLERAGAHAALLGQDHVDEPVELLDQADHVLGAQAGSAVQEQDRRAFGWPSGGPAPARGEDLAARNGHVDGRRSSRRTAQPFEVALVVVDREAQQALEVEDSVGGVRPRPAPTRVVEQRDGRGRRCPFGLERGEDGVEGLAVETLRQPGLGPRPVRVVLRGEGGKTGLPDLGLDGDEVSDDLDGTPFPGCAALGCGTPRRLPEASGSPRMPKPPSHDSRDDQAAARTRRRSR